MNQKQLGLMSVLFSTFMFLAVPTAEAQRNQNRPPQGMRGQQAQVQQGGQDQFGLGQGGQHQGGLEHQQQFVQKVMSEFDQDGDQMLNSTELGQMLAAMHRAMIQQGQGNRQDQNQVQQQRAQGGQRAGLQDGQQRGGGGPGRARGGQGRPGG